MSKITINADTAEGLIKGMNDLFDTIAAVCAHYDVKCWDDLTPEQEDEAEKLFGLRL